MSRQASHHDVLSRWADRPASRQWQWLPLCCLLKAIVSPSDDSLKAPQCKSRFALYSRDSSTRTTSSNTGTPIQIAICSNIDGSCGIPGSRWDGRRAGHLVFFRQSPRDDRPRHLLASSRWEPGLRSDARLPHALRTLLQRWSEPDQCPTLWTGKGLTMDPLVTALYGRWKGRVVRWTQTRTRTWATWLKRLPVEPHHPGIPIQLHISPDRFTGAAANLDLDSLLFQIVQTVHVLYLRPKSQTERLARRALIEGQPKKIHVLIPGPSRESEERTWTQHRTQAGRLMDAGAIGWYLPPAPLRTLPKASKTKGADQARWPIQRLPQLPTGDWLYHHTRATAATRPNETTAEQWWRWLMSSEPHSAWHTLVRIAVDGRLRAHGQLIPGGQPMICLTRRTPLASLQARCFRVHLKRWDFEPYGLAVHYSILQQRGVRPVTYWDHRKDRVPHDTPPAFRQKRFSGSGSNITDWSQEEEFRLPGDLDLKSIPAMGVRLFVPSFQEALRLSTYSRWPVCYLNDQRVSDDEPRKPASD